MQINYNDRHLAKPLERYQITLPPIFLQIYLLSTLKKVVQRKMKISALWRQKINQHAATHNNKEKINACLQPRYYRRLNRVDILSACRSTRSFKGCFAAAQVTPIKYRRPHTDLRNAMIT